MVSNIFVFSTFSEKISRKSPKSAFFGGYKTLFFLKGRIKEDFL